MFQSTFQLLTLVDEAQKIRGRKKLQKVIHLLKSSGMDLPFKYRYHHYGPFSSQLQAEMDQLVRQQYINENFINGAYEYTIAEKGEQFIQMLVDDGLFSFPLDKNLLANLVNKDTRFLEAFSTYVFLLEKGETKTEAMANLHRLKSHLSEWFDDVEEAYVTYINH